MKVEFSPPTPPHPADQPDAKAEPASRRGHREVGRWFGPRRGRRPGDARRGGASVPADPRGHRRRVLSPAGNPRRGPGAAGRPRVVPRPWHTCGCPRNSDWWPAGARASPKGDSTPQPATAGSTTSIERLESGT
jgi:hypothetical protein